MSKLKVLLTGGGGRVGPHLVPRFQEWFALRNFDLKPVPGDPETRIGNIQDFAALKSAMDGIDVVVHLAATADEAPFLDELVPNNVIGLYNAFQAAHEAGVRRMVFASTCQTVLSYPSDRTVQITDPVRPVTLYGATKVLGEAMGRYYHDHEGMEFVGVRIGWFLDYETPELKDSASHRALWLSPRDAAELFRRAIEQPDVGYALVFGTSITAIEWLSRASAREILGFEPQDDVVKMYGAGEPLAPRDPATGRWGLKE